MNIEIVVSFITGGAAMSMVTIVVAVAVRPHASVTVSVKVLAPVTGVKQTVSPESVPFEIVTETMLLSGSEKLNPGRQIVLKSQTNRLELGGLPGVGPLLTVTVTVVVAVDVRPQESVTVSVIVLTPATGVKQTVSPESDPLETVTEAIFPSTSVAVNPGRQIGLKSQTKTLELAGAVVTGEAFIVTVTLTVQVSASPSESVTIAVMLYRPAVSA